MRDHVEKSANKDQHHSHQRFGRLDQSWFFIGVILIQMQLSRDIGAMRPSRQCTDTDDHQRTHDDIDQRMEEADHTKQRPRCHGKSPVPCDEKNVVRSLIGVMSTNDKHVWITSTTDRSVESIDEEDRRCSSFVEFFRFVSMDRHLLTSLVRGDANEWLLRMVCIPSLSLLVDQNEYTRPSSVVCWFIVIGVSVRERVPTSEQRRWVAN